MTNTNDMTGDVWLSIPEGEEESEYEANTYRDSGGIRVEWYHTAVGQVSSRWFATYSDASAWLSSEGFDDYTSEPIDIGGAL